MALIDYSYKRKITIDHLKIDATETDYPVMIKFYSDSSVSAWTVSTYAVDDKVTNNSAYYKCTTASTTKEPGVTASWQDDWTWLGDEFDFSKIQSDGKDIRFTASDETTLLDYERELLETTTQPYQLVIHIRIPSVSSSVDTDYYMYYKEPNETIDGENKTGVWDSNFAGVWHMGDSLEDSTINAHDGVNDGSTLIDGLNGKARIFDSSNKITIGSIDNLTHLTVTGIIKSTAVENYRNIFTLSGLSGDNSLYWRFQQYSDNSNKWFDSSTTGSQYSQTTLNQNIFYNLNFLQTSSNISIYKNGVLSDSDNYGNGSSKNTSVYLGTGYDGSSIRSFKGSIDEFRVSNIERTDSWKKANDSNLRTWDLQNIGVEEFTGIFATSIVNTSVFGSPSISFDQFIQATGIDNIQTFGSSIVYSGLLIATNSITNESYIGIPYIYFDQIINGQGFENETLFGELYLRNWKIVSKPTTIWTKKDDEITIWTKQ